MGIEINKNDALFIEMVGRSLRGSRSSTLEQILDSDEIKGFANDDQLSKSQRGLIAAVVSLMQDRIIDELRANAADLRQSLQEQRLLSLAFLRVAAINASNSIGKLYSVPLPLIANTPPASMPSKRRARRLLNWGNFMTVASICLLAIAIFYTKAYASFKDRVDAQKGIIDDMQLTSQRFKQDLETKQSQLNASQEQYRKADEQATYWRAAAESSQRQVEQTNANLEATIKKAGASDALVTANQELDKLKAANNQLSAKLAQNELWKTQSVQESSTYRDLWEQARDSLQRAESRAITLNDENTRLTKENAQLSHRVSQLKS